MSSRRRAQLSRTLDSWRSDSGGIRVGARKNLLVSVDQEEKQLAKVILQEPAQLNAAELEFVIQMMPLLDESMTRPSPPAGSPKTIGAASSSADQI